MNHRVCREFALLINVHGWTLRKYGCADWGTSINAGSRLPMVIRRVVLHRRYAGVKSHDSFKKLMAAVEWPAYSEHVSGTGVEIQQRPHPWHGPPNHGRWLFPETG